MDDRVFRQPGSRGRKWIWGILAAAALLVGIAAFLVLTVNQLSLCVEVNGEPEMTVAYGEKYHEPGVKVLLRGTLFWKEGFTPGNASVTVSGTVDDESIGAYSLAYAADYRGMHAEAGRIVHVVDRESPQIILTPDPEGSLVPGMPYEEAGYQALDNYDGDITDRVVRCEQYGFVRYTVSDSSGNTTSVQRNIPPYDPLPPEIFLDGGTEYTIPTGTVYQEPGYLALDNVDGNVTDSVAVAGEVDWLTPGTYPVTYTVTDEFGNTAALTRNVTVTAAPRPETVWPQQKTIYLTFDDGPGPYTGQLLDVLDSYGVKATFFVTNRGYENMMKEIVDRGHSIGIHTVTHNYEEIYASPEAFFSDLLAMQQTIYENTGVETTLMRFPGGSSNTVSKDTCEGLMTTLTKAVQDAGFQYFDWNVDSNDAGGAKKAKTVVANVTDGILQNPVSVVLQHDIHDFSVEAVEDIIIWGLNNGYAFEPLTPNSPGFHHTVFN